MEFFTELSDVLIRQEVSRPLLVGINGIDGSGKTEFAKNLAQFLRTKTNREIETISIDGFHNPREIRYAKGRESGEGFYRDSFNINVFKSEVLESLCSDIPRYTKQIFDVRSDTPVKIKPQVVGKDAIILIEGIFLFQKQLASYFDIKIFLDISFEVALERMSERDKELYSSCEEEIKLFEKRYKIEQLIYFSEERPKEQADLVIDNTDYTNPTILKMVL